MAEATDLMKKLSLETQPKALKIRESNKKTLVDSSNGANSQIPSYERSMTPLLQDFMDPAVGYIPNYHSGYYYGSYNGAANEWDDFSRHVNSEGIDLSQGVYGENGAFMYQQCYGYTPYSPYLPAGSPVPTMGHDGQLYGTHNYHCRPLNATSPPYNPTPAAPVKGDNSTPAAAEKTAPLTMETASGETNSIVNGGSTKGHNSTAPTKHMYQNSTFTSGASYGRGGVYPSSLFQDHRLGLDGKRSPIPWFDTPLFPDGQTRPITNGSTVSPLPNGNNAPSSKNQNFRSHSPFMGFQPRPISGVNFNGYMNSIYPSKFGSYGSIRYTFPFGSNYYDLRNGCGWLAVDNKYKPRGRSQGIYGGYGNENVDGLNELNRGPRARSSKHQKGFVPVDLAVKGQDIPLSVTANDEKDHKTCDIPDKDQYNRPDFPETYADAKFYIIKSYSEDDIHKSIKYSVWASTPNGNKKLDAAYQEAQQKSNGCPVFLFFSVNTSGQFVGVAEMVGSVDFHKNFEYWQQDKWNGFFPVKWHIVKDVSNSLLKHIILENNENKPVTNSRDTQEVKLEQGLQMLKIFKEQSSKTCILEDFPFYEGRQKTIQEKKAKQQQFQKQIWEGKPTVDEKSKEGAVNEEVKLQKPLEPASVALVKETTATPANGDAANISESGSVSKVAAAAAAAAANGGLKSAAVSEIKVVANGIANGVVANGC